MMFIQIIPVFCDNMRDAQILRGRNTGFINDKLFIYLLAIRENTIYKLI